MGSINWQTNGLLDHPAFPEWFAGVLQRLSIHSAEESLGLFSFCPAIRTQELAAAHTGCFSGIWHLEDCNTVLMVPAQHIIAPIVVVSLFPKNSGQHATLHLVW